MKRRLILKIALGMVCCIAVWRFAIPGDELPPLPNDIVDIHLHVAGLGHGGSGCFVHPQLVEGWKSPFYFAAMGVSKAELEAEGDSLLVKRVSERIAQSNSTSHAVVLAMDGWRDESGVLSRDRTQVFVPNEFVSAEARKYENLLFGASVHPYRVDALAMLEQVADEGAVLVKWIPCIMGIDPAAKRNIAYYDKLVELDLPLLTHAGQEEAFHGANNPLCDPRRLQLPLSRGVRVVVAHLSTTGVIDGKDYFEWLLPMFGEHENLYADISSLTQINKLGYLYRALAKDGISERLVHGSDWPLQFFPVVSPWYQLGHVPLGKLKSIAEVSNLWDRDVQLKRAMGVSDSVFYRTRSVLRQR